MTSNQRMTALQLASALRDAMPYGAFDQEDFLAKLASSTTDDLDA